MLGGNHTSIRAAERRQTEGLGRALLKLLEADVGVPDLTSLAKRAGRTNVSPPRDKISADKIAAGY